MAAPAAARLFSLSIVEHAHRPAPGRVGRMLAVISWT